MRNARRAARPAVCSVLVITLAANSAFGRHGRLECLGQRPGVTQRDLARGHAAGQLEGNIEAAAARIECNTHRTQFHLRGGLDVECAQLVVEGGGKILRVDWTILSGQRPHDARLDVLRRDQATLARHRDLCEPARIETDNMVQPYGFDHPVRRHTAGLAEIGRAEDRHVGDRAGIVDEIANAHDLAGDGGLRLEGRAFFLRPGRQGKCKQNSNGG